MPRMKNHLEMYGKRRAVSPAAQHGWPLDRQTRQNFPSRFMKLWPVLRRCQIHDSFVETDP